MRGLWAAVWGLAALVGYGGGCGGSDAIPFSQYESVLVTASCHFDVLCGNYPDQATCVTSTQVQPHLYDTLGADIASGSVVYDGATARACIEAINGLSFCSRAGFASAQIESGCNGLFTGTVAAGAPCFLAEECAGGATCAASDTTCDRASQCCVGACGVPTPPAAVGGSCLPPQLCAPGMYCVLDPSGTATCQLPVGLGASCGETAPCEVPLYCAPTTQTCQSPASTGGTCNPELDSEDCESPDDQCDPTTSVCTRLLAPGAACASSGLGCVNYATCDTPTGTCVTRPAVGESCDPTGPMCLGGTCDPTTTTCTLTPTTGACS
jgi:hypothetical protein